MSRTETPARRGTAPPAGPPDRPAAAATGDPSVLAWFGGIRGLVDGGLPSLVFVAVHAAASAQSTRPAALAAASGAAAATALGIVVLRLAGRETLRQALGGLAGLTVAVLFAATSGEARGFFLPGILVDAAYGAVFAGSAVLGHPLVGTLYGLLHRRRDWRDDPRLRRLFVVATFGWAGLFAVRAGVQAVLYREDLPGLLAVSKLLLGWPLTFAAVVLTLAAVRRATRDAVRDIRPTATGKGPRPGPAGLRSGAGRLPHRTGGRSLRPGTSGPLGRVRGRTTVGRGGRCALPPLRGVTFDDVLDRPRPQRLGLGGDVGEHRPVPGPAHPRRRPAPPVAEPAVGRRCRSRAAHGAAAARRAVRPRGDRRGGVPAAIGDAGGPPPEHPRRMT
ncbi:DUF3159 domain-containing protein [Geodermatophilus sp. SYSU D00758]